MRRILLITLLLCIGFAPSFAQELGYIKDEDGYTNLRLKPSGKSDIIGIIISGQRFTYYPEKTTNWWKVDFKFRSGFIHKSRIQNLEKIKSDINRFFQEFYSTDRSNAELGQTNNEKLFLLTRDYPSAVSKAFCEQKKEIQEFLISEYESPIHDQIDLQLIYSRLNSANSNCSEINKITDALEIATIKLGYELKNVKPFPNKIPDYNRPDKNLTLTNSWFVKKLNEKPITYYLNHPEIDTYSKMFYQGQFALSDDTLTFALLDSVLTTNERIQPFYLHVFNYAVKVADGALAEIMGSYCKTFFERNPCQFMDLKTNKYYGAYYQKWIDFVAFEYLMEHPPTESINKNIDLLKTEVQADCKNKINELENIRIKLIECIKDNE